MLIVFERPTVML